MVSIYPYIIHMIFYVTTSCDSHALWLHWDYDCSHRLWLHIDCHQILNTVSEQITFLNTCLHLFTSLFLNVFKPALLWYHGSLEARAGCGNHWGPHPSKWAEALADVIQHCLRQRSSRDFQHFPWILHEILSVSLQKVCKIERHERQVTGLVARGDWMGSKKVYYRHL